ncbi:hypothetical protein AGDE_09097 [Angomonas deanei]|uniref:Uncharacterized protein n=1 Tax=Angomonas deanei TaxID=59799 RepID=A0A7G2CQH5_9TRYP|nr:hypothetical protein AGDE_09097 [Angomonas deanei]CAD2221725.1 hypothetical protein, conserved [Angomonas deanei]|eukprot:EPY31348.1 hypothetical protein AGDE_09097 [Angomonas deanei]
MKLSPQYTLSHPEVAKGLDGRQREVPYYGYWENTPLSGEPLPQRSRRVRHNPYTAPDGDTFPLFVGHNLVGYFVSDVDEVCDPVPLEGHDLWSVQSILLTPSPATACTNSAEVEALQLHRLLHRMRRERGFQVNIRNTSWTSEEAESAVEGRYRCRSRREYDRRRSPNSPVEYDGTCEATPTVMGGLTETTAELSLPRRGVFDVEWIARVVVGNRSLLIKENIDPNVTAVLPAYAEEGEARTDLEIKSNTLIVVRRLHSYPSHVEVELPMYRRRMAVAAPTPTGQLRDTKRVTLQGYWRVRAPLVQMSIDERLQVELDTSSVPNVRRVLPEGSLQFVVQDPGEDLASTHGIPYTSRCPDFGVEYVVRVVALLAPPIVPAYEIVYTEEACVEVEAPRAGHKDEVVRWQVLPCPAAVAPPYMVELPIVDEETDLTVWRACGVEVHHWCEVVWSATNLVGVVNKTYSLRRCERPPEVFFHQNGDQQVEGLPVRYFYPLPIRTEEPSQQTPHAVVPVTDGLEAEWGTLEEVYPGTARRRTILPVAGYEAEFGYSFNTTGKHAYYEANFTPVRLEVACQYNVTKTHYIRLGADVNERICFRPRHHTDDGRLPEEEEGSVLLEEVSNDEKFWSHFNTAQAREEHEADAENYFERRREAIRRRENRLDKVLGDTFTLTHTPLYRRLHYTPLGESTFIPYDYVIRTSRESEVPQEDREQFALRGMCRQREGYTSLFVVNPKGSVELDDRYGTVWPPPAPPAIGVLPFCAPRMIFSRHPDLYKTYMFDYTWTCNESDIITVTKQDPMISTFIHSEYDPDGTGRPVNVNSTNCRLKVYNHATRTMKEDWFLVKRVYPTRFPNSRFIIFGYNSVSTVLSFVRRTDRKGRPLREANARGEYVVVPTPHKTRRVVGSRVLLHVDSPASPHLAVWAVTAATPHSAKVTSAHMIDLTHFTPHFQSKEALERGKGGATATLSGLEYSGLYTVTHYQPDPVYPNVCPNATLEETLEVFRAEVTLKTAFVCGATASIHAVPIPKEISHQFIGQWEVVSLETAPGEVWTGGPSLSGIRFDHENHGNTLVHGLPFGVLTLRWAIYRLLPDQLETVGGEETEADLEELNRLFGGTDRVNFTAGKESYRRELVDYDDMTVYVITENLLSDQVVTLSDTADILRTSSTVNWVIEHDPSKAVRLSSTPIQNYTLLQTSETEETRNMFEELRERYPYIGKQPRPGTELLTADRLPVGSVKLGYDLQPSRNVFGLMKDHTCSMRGVLHIERVSAFLTANTTMDHECDGYTGRGKITLCLHAERGGHPSSRKERQLSRVRLIPLTEMERTLKKGALEVERKGCSVPWWTWEKTKWENITEVRPMDLPARRCFEFIATAGRHLSPREVSHPLFMSLHGANLPPESEVTCKDFISSRIMEGATHHSRTDPQNVGPHLFPFSSTSQRNTQPYLIPVLETNSLQRLNISMRPMLGDQRMPDEVTTELNVSRGGESVVTLKMDLSAPDGWLASLWRRPIRPRRSSSTRRSVTHSFHC